MEIAEQRSFKTVKGEVRRHDATIFLGYSIFAIAPGDLASMTVFP
jgi:hypothetical protein